MISSVMLRLINQQVRMQDPEAQEVSGERMAVRRADIRSITLKAAVWMIFSGTFSEIFSIAEPEAKAAHHMADFSRKAVM